MSKSNKRPRKNVGGTVRLAVPSDTNDSTSIRFNQPRTVASGGYHGTASQVQVLDISTENWKNAMSWAPADNHDFALDPNSNWYDKAVDAPIMEEPPAPPHTHKRKERSRVSKWPNVVWTEQYCSEYLDELMRLEGRGDFIRTLKCPECVACRNGVTGKAVYRCVSGCLVPTLVCAECCIRIHKQQPFHRIESWNDKFFEAVSLKSLGLRIQLNHTSACPAPIPCHSNLTVLHTNSIHEVAFDYCGCARSIPQYVQLLRRRIYPASQKVIQTCATFPLLDLFHKLALTSKGSMYDLYNAIEKLTNSTSLCTPKSKYRILMRMMLQYQHLKMAKWGGRAFEPSGIEGTAPGDLAVSCLLCPYPGINLPDNWKSAPEEDRFLYRGYVVMDANFRLKNQLVSNYSQDPGMATGLAFMLVKRKDDDISTCVGFQAISQANTRFSRGLRYTGVAGVLCARSETVLLLGVGNLQKGERFSVMDYVFTCAIKKSFSELTDVLISYDIACQWFVNLKHQMQENVWPAEVHLPTTLKFTPAIPKLHEPMHAQGDNHQQYSLNYIHGVGHLDGECPEQCWSCHNALGNSTKNNAPGSRNNIVDDNFNWWNWLKAITMGSTLARRFRQAVADRNLQVEAHRSLMSRIDPILTKEWDKKCTTWDKDAYPKRAENPYKYAVNATEAMTEAAVHHEFAKMEEERLAKGGSPQTPPAAFISAAIEIEDTQRRLKRLAKITPENAARREGGLAEQRNQLWSRICAWEVMLPIFMPGLPQYLKKVPSSIDSDPQTSKFPENDKIWVPSLIPKSHRASVCNPTLSDVEDNEGVRKKKQGRPGTLEDGHVDTTPAAPIQTDDYSLDPEEGEEGETSGETRKEISWIWLTPKAATEEKEGSDGILSVEWAKSQAHCRRASEEVRLLQEEMRRTLATLEWKAVQWLDLIGKRKETVDPMLSEGLRAYANCQSTLQLKLRDVFKAMWKSPLTDTHDVDPKSGDDDEDEDEDEDGSDSEDENDKQVDETGAQGQGDSDIDLVDD